MVASATRDSVVALDATLPGGGRTTGTGIVLTAGGEVIASYHVVESATSVHVRTADAHVYEARVVGYDLNDDIALLQIDGAQPMHAIDLGDASTLTPGTPIAVASTSGVTAGTVTAVHRVVTAGGVNDPDGIETLHDMIAIDVPSRPGDTGAPVADDRGRVVAIVTAATHGRRFNQQGSGAAAFAMPVPDVVAIADQIDAGENNGTVHAGPPASLGATIEPVPGGGSGVLVTAVPATSKNLAVGDIVVAINDATIASPADLATALNAHKRGDIVRVGFVDPKGVYHSANLTLQ
jgi:S1-C subfamily serine protease